MLDAGIAPFALLFPGQGSQTVGMGVELARVSDAARAVLLQAEERSSLPIGRVCAEGPAELLTETLYAQVALVATGLAALAALRERLAARDRRLAPTFAAGHSVGELAALVAAGAADLDTALELVRWRASYIQDACRLVDGTMAAVLGLPEATVAEVCATASEQSGHGVDVANLNAPGNVSISGHRSALELAVSRLRAMAGVRVVPLRVAGAFHSRYMRPAAHSFGPIVQRSVLRDPSSILLLNLTGRPASGAQEIAEELVTQVYSTVRWSDCVMFMAERGCRVFLELGPGGVLSSLIRRMIPGAKTLDITDRKSLDSAVETLLAPTT